VRLAHFLLSGTLLTSLSSRDFTDPRPVIVAVVLHFQTRHVSKATHETVSCKSKKKKKRRTLMGQTRRDVPSLFEATHTVQLSRNLVKASFFQDPINIIINILSSLSMAIFGVAYAYYNNARPASRHSVSPCFKCGEHVYTTGKPIHFALPFLPQPPMTFSPSV
jgi:hypothetical protein